MTCRWCRKSPSVLVRSSLRSNKRSAKSRVPVFSEFRGGVGRLQWPRVGARVWIIVLDRSAGSVQDLASSNRLRLARLRVLEMRFVGIGSIANVCSIFLGILLDSVMEFRDAVSLKSELLAWAVWLCRNCWKPKPEPGFENRTSR